MHSRLRSQVVSLALLAALPFAVGCGPEVSAREAALAGERAALGAVADAHVDAGTVATDKVAVCHIPPGNPANAHTIVVGEPALSAHLRHGDVLGACGGEGGEPDGGSDELCQASGESCGGDNGACCFGLTCGDSGLCVPQIN